MYVATWLKFLFVVPQKEYVDSMIQYEIALLLYMHQITLAPPV